MTPRPVKVTRDSTLFALCEVEPPPGYHVKTHLSVGNNKVGEAVGRGGDTLAWRQKLCDSNAIVYPSKKHIW